MSDHKTVREARRMYKKAGRQNARKLVKALKSMLLDTDHYWHEVCNEIELLILLGEK
jgi:hypothetical protein